MFSYSFTYTSTSIYKAFGTTTIPAVANGFATLYYSDGTGVPDGAGLYLQPPAGAPVLIVGGGTGVQNIYTVDGTISEDRLVTVAATFNLEFGGAGTTTIRHPIVGDGTSDNQTNVILFDKDTSSMSLDLVGDPFTGGMFGAPSVCGWFLEHTAPASVLANFGSEFVQFVNGTDSDAGVSIIAAGVAIDRLGSTSSAMVIAVSGYPATTALLSYSSNSVFSAEIITAFASAPEQLDLLIFGNTATPVELRGQTVSITQPSGAGGPIGMVLDPTGAGGGASVLIAGNQTAGNFVLTVGAGSVAGRVAEVTQDNPFPTNGFAIMLMPASPDAVVAFGSLYAFATSTDTWEIWTTAPLNAGDSVRLSYLLFG